MRLLIQNGIVIDPARKLEEKADVLIEDGRIIKIGNGLSDFAPTVDTVIEAAGCFVMPGFVDLHVHLREPGFEYKETIKTGSEAAARGGFTTICAMPNTRPVIDNVEYVDYVHNKAREEALVRVLQIGAVTQGQEGQHLSDINEMVRHGIPAISEDGKTVMDTGLYLEGMKIAAKCKIPVFAHCEDKNLVGNGVLNAGPKAEELGVDGISNLVEDIITARDIMLAREAGAHLHLCHCSTKGSVALIKMAKKAGCSISAEVCPHHFTLTEDDIPGDDPNYKMNPPLRTKEDVQALIQGLKENIIDIIATDHAPHHYDEKNKSIREAPFGITGLETAASLTYTELVDKGCLTVMQMAEKMSYNPAKIIGLDAGSIQEGKTADIAVFHPEKEYTVDVKEFASMGKNSPFDGRKVKGQVVATICGGKIVFKQEEQK